MTKGYDKDDAARTRLQIELDLKNRDDMLRQIEHTVLQAAQEIEFRRHNGGDDSAVADQINWMRGQLQRWSNIRYYMQNQRAMLKKAK